MTSDKKPVSGKEIAGTLFSVLLALIFLYIAFKGIDFNLFWQSFSKVSVVLVVIFAISTVFSHWLRALRWKVLLSNVKKDVSVHHAFGALMVGYGVNNVIPRLGEITRALLLGQYEGISRISTLGSIMLERFIDIISFGLSILIAGALYDGNIYAQFPWLKTTFIIGLIIFALFCVFLLFLLKHPVILEKLVLNTVHRFSKRSSEFIITTLQKLTNGFSVLSSSGSVIKTVILSAAIMLNYGFTSYLGFYMVGMDKIMNCSFSMAWIVMSISAIGVMIPTPGGIGSYHTITKAVLVMLYAAEAYSGILYAFLTHAISYVASILIGLAYFFSFRKRYGKLKQSVIEEVESEEKA